MKVFLLFLSIIFFVGCSSDKGDYIECGEVKLITSFPEEIELPETTPLPIDITGCLDLIHADSLLICKMDNDDYFWKIISLNTLQSLGSYVRKGHGHEEFARLPSSEFVHRGSDFILCNIFDSNTQTLYSCNLTESINRKKLIVHNKQEFGDMNSICYITLLPDSSYYIVKYHNNCGFIRSIVTSNGMEKTIECGNLNKLMSEEINVLSASRAVNIERKKVAEAMLRFNQINLYSLDEDKGLTLSMGSKRNSLSSTISQFQQKRWKYFGGIYSTNKWFGALYYDMPLKYFFTDEGKKSCILFFDWDGNPLLKITIPYIATSFFIHNNDLYVFSNAMENEKIYKYSLAEMI